ncbi:MAG: aminoglycoside phosphotransferase family protein [Myxococcota bacterium]
MSVGEHVLRSRGEFQRFCARLHEGAPDLDELVEGLRALAASDLRSRDKGRFARSIARHLRESFHAAQVRAVASVPWPPEIAMAIRSHVAADGAGDVHAEAGSECATASRPASVIHAEAGSGCATASRPASVLPEQHPGGTRTGELLGNMLPAAAPVELAPVEPTPIGDAADERTTDDGRARPQEIVDPLDPPTVVLLGEQDEHLATIEHLTALGFGCRAERTIEGLEAAFAREIVVGLVVGSSFWSLPDPEGRSLRGRLARVLQTSNLCWTKLVRSPAWSSVQEQLPELCTQLHFRDPPVTRLAVEDDAAISKLEMRCLADAARDILYAERNVEYGFSPTILQDRIIRAVTSRYLRQKFPSVHEHEAGLRVRPLADPSGRAEQRLVGLVSVVGTEVSFVVKVAAYADAADEARRFRMFASGVSFEMEFYCHATLGALVFAPVDTRLADARSLEDVLTGYGLAPAVPTPAEGRPPGLDLIDSAIAALERFSRQALPAGVRTYCDLESARTREVLRACPRLTVAGQSVDVERLYRHGVDVLDRASNGTVVHGDAHPGNILFSATNSAILIDYECAGLGPVCCDLCTLWIFAFVTRFIAVDDERATVALFQDLLAGAEFEAIARRWTALLALRVNYELAYLAWRALDASVRAMQERGLSRADVLGIVAVLLCRELFVSDRQQLVVRCGLAALQAALEGLAARPNASAASPDPTADPGPPRAARPWCP